MVPRILLCLLLLASVVAPVFGYDNTPPAETKAAERQYTFAWQFLEGSDMAPRGGTTKGEQPTLVREPSAQWQALQEAGLSSFERDRRAILTMAGEYRASFDFIEVAGFSAGWTPSRPYQSWGSEKVYVLEDDGTRIVLQHVLVMRIVKEDGSIVGPFVTSIPRETLELTLGRVRAGVR